jgi:ribonuclease R
MAGRKPRDGKPSGEAAKGRRGGKPRQQKAREDNKPRPPKAARKPGDSPEAIAAKLTEGMPSGKGRRAPKPPKEKPGLPSREAVLRYIADHPGKAGKREIARAFGISGGDRIGLKQLLKDLADEGLVSGARKHIAPAGELPAVTVITVVGRDADGDLLAVPSEWNDEAETPPRIRLSAPRGRQVGPAAATGDRVLARIARAEPHEDAAYVARPIKVLERKADNVLGVLRTAPGGYRAEPVDRRQREVLLAADAIGDGRPGDLVEVALVRSSRFGPSHGRVVAVVGPLGNEKAVSLIAIHAHDIPHVFPQAVLDAAARAAPATLDHREDWRDLPLVTIDPPDAKDHDDAVHAEPDADPANPGGWIVTVAIADVAWYVRPADPLDREALKRGNSVYFPDRVVPMLPERISNDLCSLREKEDRPALAVRMVFDASGRKKNHRFHRVMMRSAAKLSYREAQDAFDGHPKPEAEVLMRHALTPLWQAYECLKRGRDERGPLDLDIPERKVIVGPSGAIERIVVPERLEAHRLIEEFMIQANVAAAETLEAKKSPLLYRIHDAPSLDKLESLRQFLKTLEIALPKEGNLRPSSFNGILRRVEETEHKELVHQVVLRSQSQAEYSPDNIGHFGLNLRRYAHFTSPIRRYADLIVHRALVSSLGLGPGGLPEGAENELGVIAAEISAAERRAMVAERDTVDRLVAHWLADRIGATFHGRIAGVTRAGLFVKLAETGADGFVPISSLGHDYYLYDEARHAVIGRDSGEMHRLGDEVDVRLLEVAPLAGALRFELLSEGRVLSRKDRHVRPGRRDGRPASARPQGKGRGGPKRDRRR